jgi:hypothetical protein
MTFFRPGSEKLAVIRAHQPVVMRRRIAPGLQGFLMVAHYHGLQVKISK